MKAIAGLAAAAVLRPAQAQPQRDYPVKLVPFTVIPYYAWANRGRGQMMPDNEASARPASFPTVATTAKVTVSSNPHHMNPDAVKDGETPASSAGSGGVRVPASRRILYQDGDDWKPVEAAGSYSVARDQFNSITFKPVTTSALRLEIQAQPQWPAGVQKWQVK